MSAGSRDDTSDRLNQYWNALVRQRIPSPHDLDPTLIDTIHQLHARDHTPLPSPLFVSYLRDHLVGHSTTTGRGRPLPHPVGERGSGSAWEAASVRRFVSPLASVMVLVLILVLGYILVGMVPTMTTGELQRLSAIQTGSPVAKACQVAPRLNAPQRDLTIQVTPVLYPVDESFPPLVTADDLPSGNPANPDDVTGVIATVGDLVGCEQEEQLAGPEVARPRLFAFYSDDYLRRLAATIPSTTPLDGQLPPWWSGYPVISLGPEMPMVTAARTLNDGRVGALVHPVQGLPYFMVFVKLGERWVVDEVVSVAT